MDPLFKCLYCGRSDFATGRALTQHQQRNLRCLTKLNAKLAGDSGYMTAQEFQVCTKVNTGSLKQRQAEIAQELEAIFEEDSLAWQKLSGGQSTTCNAQENFETAQEDFDYDSLNLLPNNDDDVGIFDNNNFDVDAQDLANNTQDLGQGNNNTEVIDRSILGNYKTYCDKAHELFLPLTKIQRDAIQLMTHLRKSKASLSTYETVMEWHLKTTGELRSHETLGNSQLYLSRKRLFDFLRNRYNMAQNYSVVKPITLPSSKAKANIVVNDARLVIQSLLTDPRVRDEDYLFFGNDPFAAPPARLNYIADLNTGLSYTETYKKLITNPNKEVLLPIPMYIDGAATGQFAHLPITAVKITLGIWNQKARDKNHLWRPLGYIPASFSHNES